MFSLMVVYIWSFCDFLSSHLQIKQYIPLQSDSELGGSLDQILTGCAARERQNPLISKEDERTK